MDALKVDAIELVLVDHVQNRASKCGAVFWRGHCSGVVQRARPATNREECLNVLRSR